MQALINGSTVTPSRPQRNARAPTRYRDVEVGLHECATASNESLIIAPVEEVLNNQSLVQEEPDQLLAQSVTNNVSELIIIPATNDDVVIPIDSINEAVANNEIVGMPTGEVDVAPYLVNADAPHTPQLPSYVPLNLEINVKCNGRDGYEFVAVINHCYEKVVTWRKICLNYPQELQVNRS